MKKTAVILLAIVMTFAVAGCGSGSGSIPSQMETPEAVNLAELPEGCDLIPYDKFKEGFAFVSNTNWEEPPASYDEIAKAFGNNGVYYKGSDITYDGIDYKTYAWFSDEEWLDSTVSVAVTFKTDQENRKLVYYSYVSQGIVYTDVQE